LATPLILGQFYNLALCLWKETPAFKIGFSVLPPPAMIPTMALTDPFKVFLDPDGNLTLVFDPSSECPIMVA